MSIIWFFLFDLQDTSLQRLEKVASFETAFAISKKGVFVYGSEVHAILIKKSRAHLNSKNVCHSLFLISKCCIPSEL